MAPEKYANLDIFKYPDVIFDVEFSTNELKTMLESYESRVSVLEGAAFQQIMSSGCRTSTKNKELLQMAINAECIKNQEYIHIQENLIKIRNEIREQNTLHALLRRRFRLLEMEYPISGTRQFENLPEGKI